eukprot:CAMPEP_0194748540 /NCGR_PEP_ID=MMETSP0323_2-20130528/2663_1 /TAXON_ID=2866 ORGANISM="Crypthecodinium cohnii, Strain Seligo" /NCGR_SAMPLE_ID=MMETSP0323_2 /ASSEMBLY_ACC=CAM_ASM_000346 /LENGTH=48 /DNA_ID= /DNA_START= /DNA_END= /DNA_ORIENTATION=
MQFRLIIASLAVAASSALSVSNKGADTTSKLDINQKVYIENAPVLGDG